MPDQSIFQRALSTVPVLGTAIQGVNVARKYINNSSPSSGTVRWNDETETFERFTANQWGADRWVPLAEDDELVVEIKSLLASGEFDGIENDEDTGEVSFHRAGGTEDDWSNIEGAKILAENASTYGPKPSDWPDYEEWPPMRIETTAEARLSGHVDAAGKADPWRVVNTKAVTAAREKESKVSTSGNYASAAEATKAAQANPELSTYEPTRIQSTGQWQLAPREEKPGNQPKFHVDEDGQRWLQKSNGDWSPAPKGESRGQSVLDAQTDQLDAERALVEQQQQGGRQGPSSMDDLLLEAIDGGDIDKAHFIQDVENDPSPVHLLELKLKYTDNPAALQMIDSFARERRPDLFGGGPSTSPFQQRLQVDSVLSRNQQPWGPRTTSGTTEELQAADRQRDMTQSIFASRAGGSPFIKEGGPQNPALAQDKFEAFTARFGEEMGRMATPEESKEIWAMASLNPNVGEGVPGGDELLGDFMGLQSGTGEGGMGRPALSPLGTQNPMPYQATTRLQQIDDLYNAEAERRWAGGGMKGMSDEDWATLQAEVNGRGRLAGSPFNPNDLQGYLGAVDSASKVLKPRKRSPFGRAMFPSAARGT